MEYPIEIIRNKIDNEFLDKFVDKPFKEMIKFVVDIERELIALGGELHVDAEEVLIENGSQAKNLWGANIYLNKPKEERIEFFSLINVRPIKNNRSMDIQDKKIRGIIIKIVNELIP